jgi:hypothetical protein
MNSAGDTAEAVGCPIRKSTDQSLLAAPRGLSQRAASFIASQCQGIHQMPFRRLISTYECATRRRKPTRNLPPARNRIRQRCIIMTQPTLLPLPEERPVGLSSVTCSLHMSKIPYPPAGGYLCSLSRISLVPGHQWSLNVIKGHCSSHCRPPGGGGRDRTDDLMLAKHALSQLSYAPTGKDQWWAREDLNFRPHAYQARALTN